MNIKKLLIANRGEIAVRVIRAAKELGIHTVQVFSDADADSLAVHLADESCHIGPPQAAKSYLCAEGIINSAKIFGVDAIHPGYGFFSENADFVDAIEKEGMIFIGPSGDTIRKMGDKVEARKTADAVGVPTVPGSNGRIDDLEEAKRIAQKNGFPLMIKAAAGGGGRGIRVVSSMDEFAAQVSQASVEAKAAFGDGGLYIEKFIEKGRHIEVQILGDGSNFIHFFERECSLQRRRQKVWEEAPASVIPDQARTGLRDAAVKLAAAVKYSGAGTVEFLYDDTTGEFYFIEMNTRIQVEHPVTEMITSSDLVRQMIRIADGEKIQVQQKEILCRGHAIEVRLNAEDPANRFIPFPGEVQNLRVPAGPGVRFDAAIYPGYLVPPFYDSLLGKLIVWDETRSQAIKRMERALGELEISGLKTTKPLFVALADDEEVRRGDFDTRWLEQWLETNATKLYEQEVKAI